ncbi:MAG TPA: glycosyltransferase family A protein, partial [Chitinophagaceae bacterium]|nr:glycosyltransferase family A protein [Chitinophagaceae bacterium]
MNSDQIVPPELSTNAAYVIIWWKEIPIGELFIEQGRTFASKEYYYLVIDAISATVDQYATKQGLNPGEYNLHALHNIFAAYTDLALPASVDVSVIICTRDRALYVQRCLESLSKIACAPKEIIVIDNAPKNDDTKNIVSNFPNVIYHKEPRPGLDIARNCGIAQATSPIVAFVDDDVTVHPH